VRAGAEVEITIHDNRKPLISRLGNRGQPGNSSLSTPSRPTCGAGNSGKSGAAVRCSEAAPPRPRSPQGGRQQSRQQLTRGAFLRQGIRDQRALNGRPGSGAAVRRRPALGRLGVVLRILPRGRRPGAGGEPPDGVDRPGCPHARGLRPQEAEGPGSGRGRRPATAKQGRQACVKGPESPTDRLE
jgi:hypothetical protein